MSRRAIYTGIRELEAMGNDDPRTIRSVPAAVRNVSDDGPGQAVPRQHNARKWFLENGTISWMPMGSAD
jgi:hypothetical protein